MDAKREWEPLQLAKQGFLGSAEEPPNDPEHGDEGGSNGEDREGVESPASVGGRLAEAELGSTTGARVGHLGAGRDVEMADIGTSDEDDYMDYVDLDGRSSATCAEDMDSEWMIVRRQH